MATIVKPLAAVNGAQITINNAGSFGMFSGAVHALSICLINLVNNAAKHSGGDRIELRADYEGTMLSFVVADNGFGIPESQQQLVFQRCRRRPGVGWAGRARRCRRCALTQRAALALASSMPAALAIAGVHCGGCAAASADRLQPRRPLLRVVGLHS
ncbi:ATP-binding protein [Xanthomonas campestris]|uniref:ATP-binding protein n=1 Tax=Xanthomonas campestris TaxID=339 RepID=UPI001F5CA264|nr:ATP-binding protein [Xanthomonas campestris]